jgi:quinol-cytochrome oxidoreductase complex cytochrome b subunit
MHPDNYIPANPLVTPVSIVPEWYFLPFYAILRAIPSKLGGVICMFGALLILLALPWLETSKIRGAGFRPVMKFFFWLFVVNFFLLTWLGSQHAEEPFVTLSRIGTAYYFSYFFIIIPVIGHLENLLNTSSLHIKDGGNSPIVFLSQSPLEHLIM